MATRLIVDCKTGQTRTETYTPVPLTAEQAAAHAKRVADHEARNKK